VADFEEFVTDYYSRFIQALQSFDREPLKGVLSVIDDVIAQGGTLWTAGNGGSAAISNHAVCDLTKWTYVEGHQKLRCNSLASNVPMITALGNDIGYDQVFSRQLTYYLKPADALLLVSSSGNSPNVVKACELANAEGIPTIAFVGFKGGKLKELAKHAVWIPVENYGMVEDAHQSLMHVLTQYIRVRTESVS
jgi:D-sedoheptulose 7-phosphate isomerase